MLALKTALAIAALATVSLAQSTWYVDVNAAPPGLGTPGAPYSSIQYAISRPTTLNGDNVLVLPGNYAERLDYLGKTLSVRSTQGAAVTTIDAQALGAGVVIASGEGPLTSLMGFTVINGSGVSALGTRVGGGVYCSGTSPTILDCVIENCTATLGGGIAAIGGSPLISQSVIRSNVAATDFSNFIDGEGGGVFLLNALSASIQDCAISQNSCDGSGAGVLSINSTLNMGVVSVSDNHGFGAVFGFGGEGGGGLAVSGGGSAQVSNCTFARNVVLGGLTPSGGGVAAGSPVTLSGCTLEDNEAGDSFSPGAGGGVAGQITAVSCALLDNYGELFGGGAFGGVLTGCTLQGNCSSNGAGAYGSQLFDSTLQGNVGCGSASEEFGGGAVNCALVRCIVRNNLIFGHGGGAYNSTLTECEVSGNISRSPGGGYTATGGGIEGGSAVDCRIALNRCEGDTSFFAPEPAGAGAYSASLLRCELVQNVVVDGTLPGIGGGAANCTLTFCSVYGNQASEGGGVFGGSVDRCTLVGNQALSSNGGGADSATVASCIVRGNTPSQVSSSTVRYSNVQGGVGGIGNINSDPLFWNAATDDYHLRPGSPCINSGDPAAPLDLDGSRADMGAHPFDPNYCTSPVSYCTAKTNSLGCLPTIGWSGAPTLSGADDFSVQASDVIGGRFGVLFWGYQPNATPYQGGWLCVIPPTIRTPAQLSAGAPGTCAGAYSHAFTQAYMAQSALVAGQQIYLQWWMRDPGAFSNTGLSNALAVTICP